jgi:phosphoribosyl-AMP cyclohydrolase / phosphoribosyl-ATP pyrophosphohydrolase
MSYKRLIPCIFIKDGKAVRWIDDPTVVSKDVIELAKYYRRQYQTPGRY